MVSASGERYQILRLVESGKVSAKEAEHLLDALVQKKEQTVGRKPERSVRVRVTNLATNRQFINVTVPVTLIHVGLRLATRLVPQISDSSLEDLLRASERGATGRLLDLQDLEEGERVEIFAE